MGMARKAEAGGATAAPPASYLRLIRRFPLRPIRSEDELDRATAVIHALIDRDDSDGLDEAEADYLDVLGTLVREYELVHHPIPPAPDAAMLASLMDSHGLNQSQVAEGAGIPHSVVSEVLGGKRRLSRNAIGRIAAFFRVSPAVFAFGDPAAERPGEAEGGPVGDGR